MNETQDEFKALLKSRWFSQIRDLDVGDDIRRIICAQSPPISEGEFKRRLADAIVNNRFSMKEYENLTGLDFDTQAELAADLISLWRLVFGEEPFELQSAPSERG